MAGTSSSSGSSGGSSKSSGSSLSSSASRSNSQSAGNGSASSRNSGLPRNTAVPSSQARSQLSSQSPSGRAGINGFRANQARLAGGSQNTARRSLLTGTPPPSPRLREIIQREESSGPGWIGTAFLIALLSQHDLSAADHAWIEARIAALGRDEEQPPALLASVTPAVAFHIQGLKQSYPPDNEAELTVRATRSCRCTVPWLAAVFTQRAPRCASNGCRLRRAYSYSHATPAATRNGGYCVPVSARELVSERTISWRLRITSSPRLAWSTAS